MMFMSLMQFLSLFVFCVLLAHIAVLAELKCIDGVLLVSLAHMSHCVTDRTLEAYKISLSFFCHGSILPNFGLEVIGKTYHNFSLPPVFP
jgi:hypothetical protein